MRRTALIGVALLALTACGQATTTSPSAPAEQGWTAVTIEHAMGKTEIKDRPKKVAALDSSYVDATLALETEVVAYTRYRTDGLPDYLADDAAKYAKNAKAVGELANPNLEELATIEVTGESGAGLVKVTMTCKHDVKRVEIDPSLLADDKDMLEDLVAAAFNAAVRKAEETSQEKMAKITAGMPGLPGGMKLPF